MNVPEGVERTAVALERIVKLLEELLAKEGK